MQNSIWKLLTAAGVIAIGSLVVLEVQRRIPVGTTSTQNIEPGPRHDDQLNVTPSEKPSELEQHLSWNGQSHTDPFDAAGEIHDSFDLRLDEPDLGSHDDVNNSVDRAALTDGHHPFAPVPADEFEGSESSSGSDQFYPFTDEPKSEVAETSDPFNSHFGVPAEATGSPSEAAVASEPEVVAAVLQDRGASDSFTDTAPADSELTAQASHEPRSGGVSPLIFMKQDDETESRDTQSGQVTGSSSDRSSSSSHVPYTGGVTELNEGLQVPGDVAIEFGDSSALRPIPDTATADPEVFVGAERGPDDGAAMEADSSDDADSSMFAVKEGEETKSVPSFEESVEFTDQPNPVPDTADERHDLTIVDDDSSDESDGSAFEAHSSTSIATETESLESHFELTPNNSLPPRLPETPGHSQFPRADNPADEHRDDSELQGAPFPRQESGSTEIWPRDGRRRGFDESAQPMEIFPAESFDRLPAANGVLRPHLTVRKQIPSSATLGQPLNYTLILTNESNSPAKDIIVEDVVPDAARINAVDPAADYDEETRRLIWRFDELESGDSRKLKVQLTPTGQGIVSSVATVKFRAEVTTTTVIQAPRLSLELVTPRRIKVGEETQLRYMVRNDGDGIATNVMLRSDLPEGLQHPIGNDLEYSIETLKPGENREIVLDVVAAELGSFTSTAELLAAGVSGATAEAMVNIVGQQIQLVRRGPVRCYVGRPAKYENILKNETAIEASGVRVIDRIPEGMKFDRASHNGVYNPQDRAVVWNLDRIDAAKTTTLTIELVALESGRQESSVTVVENAGFETAARHVTEVRDLHNIGIRMSRLDGPVFVGEEFGFDIVVRNRGTADATGIQLVIDLPSGIKGVSVGRGGPRALPDISRGQLSYRFDPVSRIGRDAEMTFHINLKATKLISNGVVNARVRYDQMQKELVTSEAVTAGDNGL